MTQHKTIKSSASMIYKLASHSSHIERMRYARVLHFPCNPNPPRACLAAHILPLGFKGRLKKRLRRLFHLPCDKGYLKNSCC